MPKLHHSAETIAIVYFRAVVWARHTTLRGCVILISALERLGSTIDLLRTPSYWFSLALFSIDWRKNKVKVSALVNLQGHRQASKPINTRSKGFGHEGCENVWASHDWFGSYFWLVEKMGRVPLSQTPKANRQTNKQTKTKGELFFLCHFRVYNCLLTRRIQKKLNTVTTKSACVPW